MTKRLTDQDFKVAAQRLGVDEASVRAVTEVESLGSGFLSTGQIKILFERHVMYRLLKETRTEIQLMQLEQQHPQLVNRKAGGYATGANADARGIAEHQRLVAARKIENWTALRSCSWGMFQIMGFHWSMLGYQSPVDFVLTLSRSEANQLEAFCRFIEKNTQLLNALRTRDWVQFARLYNGSNFAKNQYDSKLRNAYRKWSKLL